MKQKALRKPRAMTLVELIVVLAVLSLLAAMLLPAMMPAKQRSNYITCASNLKEIGTAYRLWAADNGGLPPSQQIMKKGGWSDCLTNANQGAICWTNYLIMADELGQSPNMVVCPNEARKAASSFSNLFDNTHVSYFVGVCANDVYPQSIMGGDRNLGPGTKPDPDYGFSPKSGKGNDVILPISSPVSWTLKIHSAGNPAGAGNILRGDGSGEQASTAFLRQMFMPNAQGTNNWPAGFGPATPSIRLVFP